MAVLQQIFILLACALIFSNSLPYSGNGCDGQEEEEDEGCWPELKSILIEIYSLVIEYEEVYQLMYGETEPPTREQLEQIMGLVACTLEGIDSIEDLAQLISIIGPEEFVRELYSYIQVTWKAMDGMDGIKSISSSLDKVLQLAVDIDFPNQLPVTSLTREELLARMTEYRDALPTITKLMLLLRGVDLRQHLIQLTYALVDSSNVSSFLTKMHFADSLQNIWYVEFVGRNLPFLQIIIDPYVKLIGELEAHGFMDLK